MLHWNEMHVVRKIKVDKGLTDYGCIGHGRESVKQNSQGCCRWEGSIGTKYSKDLGSYSQGGREEVAAEGRCLEQSSQARFFPVPFGTTLKPTWQEHREQNCAVENQTQRRALEPDYHLGSSTTRPRAPLPSVCKWGSTIEVWISAFLFGLLPLVLRRDCRGMGGAGGSLNPFNSPDIVHLCSSDFLDESEKERSLQLGRPCCGI